MKHLICVVIAVSGAAAACNSERRDPQTVSNYIDRVLSAAYDTVKPPAPVARLIADTLQTPPPPPVTIALALAPVPGATLTGSGKAKSVGHATSISVRLKSQNAGTFEGMVLQGTCDRLGPTVASLIPVSADSLGIGASASDVPVPLDSLRARPHVVVYGTAGRPHACGAIGS